VTTPEWDEAEVALTAAEQALVQDSSGAPGRLSRRHFEAVERIIAAREAAAEQRGREAALREAADDQSWWLTEAMDGDFLLVDCGHIGHNDGRVGISDVRPTDLTRWVAEHLRERADREAS
jgi:hypothetical protein